MNNSSKLKPQDSKPLIVGIISGMIFTALSIYIWVQFGENTVDKLAGVVFSVGTLIHIVVWYRTKNVGYFVYVLLDFIMSIRLLAGFTNPPLVGVYRVILIILMMLYFYFLFTGKMKWKYRRILELAAKPVKSTEDGFTPRPFPAGEAEYSREELTGFAKFLAKNLVTLANFQEDRVILSVSNQALSEFFLPQKTNPETTHIVFGYNGEVSVKIAKAEYELFKEELTFDELCASFADLFKTLLELYKKGEKSKILGLIGGKDDRKT